MYSVGISEKILEMATYQDLGFIGNIQAATSNFLKLIGSSFNSIQLFFSNFISKNTIYTFTTLFILFISVTFIYNKFGRENSSVTLVNQSTSFDGLYSARMLQMKSTADYFKQQNVLAMNSKNFVLLNTSFFTVKNAGFFGPDINGSFNPQALRKALDIGARCLIFSVDYYTGSQKTDFAKPYEPCLIYRDEMGVIRSQNSGNIKDMMTVIADEGFSNTQFGSLPILVILDFKNVPDILTEKQKHLTFLNEVANQISVLDKNGAVLKSMGSINFTNQANPTTLFVQKLSDLSKKILIFTNVDTNIYTQPDTVKLNLPRNSNLRMLTHGQIYTSSGSSIANDSVTKKQPTGTPISLGKETSEYWLQTPPEAIVDAQKKTNPTYSIISNPEFKNLPIDTCEKLFTNFGVQIIPFQLFTTLKESEDFFNWWGPYAIKIRPSPVQYIVNIPVEPAKISSRLNANGGNPTPPTLNLG
jgi:hypothetical protein